MTDAVPDVGTHRVFRLMYRSRDLIPPEGRKTELGRLFSTARSNNKKAHVTGALVLHDATFVQVLEGDENAVRSLFTTIEQDPRHDSVALVDARTVADRVFSRWAMAKVAADGEPDIRLIAHEDGIAAAAGRGTTREQEELLEVMRSAARSDSPVA